MQRINNITQPFREILVLFYFVERWACPGMPDQTQKILHDLTKASMHSAHWDINPAEKQHTCLSPQLPL